MQASTILKNASILNVDFQRLVEESDLRGALVYLDPPYATRNYRIFTQYDGSSFGVQDVARLKETLRYIHSQGARFVLSYADVSEISSLKDEWRAETVSVVRNVSGFSKGRKSAAEILVRNF